MKEKHLWSREEDLTVLRAQAAPLYDREEGEAKIMGHSATQNKMCHKVWNHNPKYSSQLHCAKH